LASVQNPRTRFFDFPQLFNLDFIDFLQVFFYSFLTAFSAYKTYATIPPYKYPLKPSPFPHILSFFSLFHLYSFRFFFIAFLGANLGVKKGQGRGKIGQPTWGTKRSTLGVKVNLLLFTPNSFYRGKKTLSWV